MKVILVSLALLAAAGFASSAEARNFSGKNYMIQFMKDGMKFYSKTCTVDGTICGNWNVNG